MGKQCRCIYFCSFIFSLFFFLPPISNYPAVICTLTNIVALTVVATLWALCCFLSPDGYASRIHPGFSIIFGVTNCTFVRLHISESTLQLPLSNTRHFRVESFWSIEGHVVFSGVDRALRIKSCLFPADYFQSDTRFTVSRAKKHDEYS